MLQIVLVCKVPGFWVVSLAGRILFLDYFHQIKNNLKISTSAQTIQI
jgi:lipid-A-disaccharide synthase-like uncharacterized protein